MNPREEAMLAEGEMSASQNSSSLERCEVTHQC